MNTDVHFSSKTDLWATPPAYFAEIAREFHFDLDVCANAENAKCANFFTAEQDGLRQEWRGTCWMNPPYGNPEHPCKPNCKKKRCAKRGHHINEYVPGIIDWVKKAHKSALGGRRSCACCPLALIPLGGTTT